MNIVTWKSVNAHRDTNAYRNLVVRPVSTGISWSYMGIKYADMAPY
jgi:hypothetical protein